jgi:hypothetical protein
MQATIRGSMAQAVPWRSIRCFAALSTTRVGHAEVTREMLAKR